jgi:dihydroorotate dehydrogenase electron transfer subunit
MLRRAFSIAGLRHVEGGVELDVIYRVVGAATHWMKSLRPGDAVNLLGPLGNAFPISADKPMAWLVAGGVGLPPMLWLAAALHETNKRTVAFCGAQRAELLALTLDAEHPSDPSAHRPSMSAREFAAHGASVVLSTDDGSLGFHGYVGSAMAAHFEAAKPHSGDLVVYTCGPEPMMRFVAEFCLSREIECYLCVERNMACGTGMCQSCVVPVRDAADPAGWSYRLCCTGGPIFAADQILWEPPTRSL